MLLTDIFSDFYPKIRPENRPKTTRKSIQKPTKNLPQAFPEYPEIANKQARNEQTHLGVKFRAAQNTVK